MRTHVALLIHHPTTIPLAVLYVTALSDHGVQYRDCVCVALPHRRLAYSNPTLTSSNPTLTSQSPPAIHLAILTDPPPSSDSNPSTAAIFSLFTSLSCRFVGQLRVRTSCSGGRHIQSTLPPILRNEPRRRRVGPHGPCVRPVARLPRLLAYYDCRSQSQSPDF
jgi:hypothetical protein